VSFTVNFVTDFFSYCVTDSSYFDAVFDSKNVVVFFQVIR